MAILITAENIEDGKSLAPSYDSDPDVCPICHSHIMPKRYVATLNSPNPWHDYLQIVFRCTRKTCGSFFIGVYEKGSNDATYYLKKLTPIAQKEENFSEEIEKLSPSFVQIYNEAISAESLNLNEVAGMGLRKALEFLIKDFAIKQKPNDEETIKKTFLGTVITNYIDDARLKNTASRAVWLGNDETHYVRKWIDKDINDLKLLIKLSVNWIENVLLTDKYSTEMN